MARKNGLECDWLFASDFGELLPNVPPWVKKGIARRIGNVGKIVLVSAVCPDYARGKKGFTYVSLSDGIPHLAAQHLTVVQELYRILQLRGISLEYHITLADTEFDLPMVIRHMTNGDVDEFTRRCQSSCDALFLKAREMGLPILTCRRFLDAFPNWFSAYGDALQEVEREVETEDSARHDLMNNSFGRELLYQAMTAERVDNKYCVSMAKRQWAQYMTWGMLAESAFGDDLVMMNHDTPNLGRVNHAFVRKGRERLPILRLSSSTMPVFD